MTPEQTVSKWADVVASDGWGANVGEAERDLARESMRVRIAARALVTLLIQKGVFTQAEWQTAQNNGADFYDASLTTRYPRFDI